MTRVMEFPELGTHCASTDCSRLGELEVEKTRFLDLSIAKTSADDVLCCLYVTLSV